MSRNTKLNLLPSDFHLSVLSVIKIRDIRLILTIDNEMKINSCKEFVYKILCDYDINDNCTENQRQFGASDK